jgi:hypothetical protein
MAVLIRIDGLDRNNSAITLRFASVDDHRLCNLDAATWWPVVQSLPALRYDLYSGAFDGRLSTPGSELAAAIEPWPDFASFHLIDARVRIWTGAIGADFASFVQRFEGIVTGQPAVADGVATIRFAVDDRWLDTSLLELYAGTGGIEGSASLEGTPKPLAIGAPRYASAVTLDDTVSILQLSAYGQIAAVDHALEKLVRFGASVGDFANYAALEAATVPAGRWATSLSQGLVRHGAPPEGKLCYLLRGDMAGADGWVRLPGEIVRRLALMAGGAGKIDDASLDAFDAAAAALPAGGTMSDMVSEQTTARDLIQRIAPSYNSVAGVSWLGKLFVAPVVLPTAPGMLGAGGGAALAAGGGAALGTGGVVATAAMILATDGSQAPMIASVEQVEGGVPAWRLAIEAERTWTVHEYGDIAFTAPLVPRGDYDAAATYREGNIVQSAGGSWLYINPTATSGNAPPDLAYWQPLATAGAPGDPGDPGADGESLFTWIAWADSADGTVNFTTGEGGTRAYMGTAANKESDTESTTPSDYVWVKVQGPPGADSTVEGPPGRDAVVFYQDAEPSDPVLGDTWITLSGKVFKRWNGAAWQQLLGDVAALSLITEAYIADASIGTAKIQDLSVSTLKLLGGSVTRRAGVDQAGTQAGTGSLETILTYNLTLPYDGMVILQASGSQNYFDGGIPDYEAHLTIDGSVVRSQSGGAGDYQASIILTKIIEMAAGSYVIAFEHRGGDDDIVLSNGALIVDAAMR